MNYTKTNHVMSQPKQHMHRDNYKIYDVFCTSHFYIIVCISDVCFVNTYLYYGLSLLFDNRFVFFLFILQC